MLCINLSEYWTSMTRGRFKGFFTSRIYINSVLLCWKPISIGIKYRNLNTLSKSSTSLFILFVLISHPQSKLKNHYFHYHVLSNRPIPSSLVPLFQSESKCETILLKMTLICMKMKLHAELIFISKISHLVSF